MKITDCPVDVQEHSAIYQYDGGLTEEEADKRAIDDYKNGRLICEPSKQILDI